MDTIDNTRYITNGKWDWEHGIGHAKRVSMYVKQRLTQLHESDRIITLGMCVALLHDIGLSESGPDRPCIKK